MKSRTAFPVGLYATLLLAACWLVMPEVLRPVERLLLGFACLPQRAFMLVLGEPAMAASLPHREQLRALESALRQRSGEHDVELARGIMPDALEPVVCAVLSCSRRGGGGWPCELRLDRSYDELAGCADLVTCGDELLGFLARPGQGAAVDDEPGDPARVLLLNHPDSRKIAVELHLPEGEPLRCLVGPAAAVDPAPMRTLLHEDPYRAANVTASGSPIRTLQLSAAWTSSLPEGLVVGRTRVWGYEVGQETLTIGLFAAPPRDPRALPQVVLWQSVPGSVPMRTELERIPAVAVPMPEDGGERWLLLGASSLPDGAAVVQDGICLGTVRSVAFRQGLCTPFWASRQPWSLWLLPDDPRSPPRGLYGEVAYSGGGHAWFRPRGDEPLPPAGFVFTGSNGPSCPPGLLIGRAEPDLQRQMLRVATPLLSGPQQVEALRLPPGSEAR
jgi:hypothetical protein